MILMYMKIRRKLGLNSLRRSSSVDEFHLNFNFGIPQGSHVALGLSSMSTLLMLQMPNIAWMVRFFLAVNWLLFLLRKTERSLQKCGTESVLGVDQMHELTLGVRMIIPLPLDVGVIWGRFPPGVEGTGSDHTRGLLMSQGIAAAALVGAAVEA